MKEFNLDPLVDQSAAVFALIEKCLLQDRHALRGLWKKNQALAKEQEKPRLGQRDFFLKLQRSVDAAESRASSFQKIDTPKNYPLFNRDYQFSKQ